MLGASSVSASQIEDEIPVNLQPAQIDYTVVAPLKARPINVFTLDGNLYVQFPKGVQVNRVQAPGSSKKTPRLSFQMEWPYLVVQDSERGANIHTNKGVVKVSARQQTVVAHYSPPTHLPKSVSFTPLPPRNTAQVNRVDGALSKMDREVDKLLAKAERHRAMPTRSPAVVAYHWNLSKGSLRLNLSRNLTKLGYTMQWKPSLDFQVANTKSISGNDVADLLKPLVAQYDLPVSLCRDTKRVIVHSFGTTPSAMHCASKTAARD